MVLLAGACEPTCRQTCRKLVDCDGLNPQGVVLDECEASCVFQQEVYEGSGQDGLRDAFAHHKACLRRESCQAVQAGVCYDDDLFPFTTGG